LPLAKHAVAQEDRVEHLETENRHLKQLIGNLSLEKKLLLERLASIETAAKD
jgi:predicted RNase H-like nuclease (RuvC/YqgF family)